MCWTAVLVESSSWQRFFIVATETKPSLHLTRCRWLHLHRQNPDSPRSWALGIFLSNANMFVLVSPFSRSSTDTDGSAVVLESYTSVLCQLTTYLSAPPTCQIILAPVRSRLAFNCKHKVHTLKEWQVSGAPPCHVHMSVSRIRRTPHRLQRLCLGRMKPCVEPIGDSFFLTHTHTASCALPRCSGAGQCVGLAGMLWHSPLVIPLIC